MTAEQLLKRDEAALGALTAAVRRDEPWAHELSDRYTSGRLDLAGLLAALDGREERA